MPAGSRRPPSLSQGELFHAAIRHGVLRPLASACRMTASAAWPLPALIEALRRTAALERRQVDVLSALSSVLPHGSAAGRATAPQISDAARYCEKWTRHTLAELEDLGLVVWKRGGVKDGRPQPSFFVISKKLLAAVIRGGREALLQRRAIRQLLARRRLGGRTLPPRGRTRRSAHAEVNANPLLHREVTATSVASLTTQLETCAAHGGMAGLLPNGTPRCPSCRAASRSKAPKRSRAGDPP